LYTAGKNFFKNGGIEVTPPVTIIIKKLILFYFNFEPKHIALVMITYKSKIVRWNNK
jgi:hypothetical protein